jgi:signal transduction histidine kinase
MSSTPPGWDGFEPDRTALSGVAELIASRMQAEHTSLAAQWFERLTALLPVDANEVFPTAALLDHVPALITDIGEYVRAPHAQAIAANTRVLEKARELGTLRHDQRASLHQVLREYQLLSDVLVAFVREEIHHAASAPGPNDAIVVVSRLYEAVGVLMRTTVETFVGLYNQTIADQAERLDQFTRMATHEWRQPLGSLQVALTLMRDAQDSPALTQRTLDVMQRNVAHLIDLTSKIESIARMRDEGDGPVAQEVSITAVAEEAARQLRDMADARGVDIRIAPELPVVVVDVGRLEMVFVNLLSNALKYADPEKERRFVEVLDGGSTADEVSILVRDNALGIPAARLGAIFQRFSRAHVDRPDARHVPGLGLGLAIVEDCIRAIDGRITVQSQERIGTTFILSLPKQPPAGPEPTGAEPATT